MEERTTQEVAAIFAAAGDSVTVINTAKTSDETTDEYNDKIKRNVEHLEIIKGYKKILQLLTKLSLMAKKYTEAKWDSHRLVKKALRTAKSLMLI
jgi:hypothetical protein